MKLYQFLIIGLSTTALAGCAHNLYLVGRKSGDTAHATITTAGNKSGDITIVLKGKTYNGRWVYMPNGGMVGFGNTVAYSGAHTAYGNGTMFAQSTQGGGTILAAASDGSRLSCEYSYNSSGETGLGLCKTSDGEEYDLQIN